MTESLGSYIRRMREARGLSQEQLAQRLEGARGCVQVALSRWERGRRIPDVEQLAAIAAALSWTDDEIADAVRLAGHDLEVDGDADTDERAAAGEDAA